MTLLLHLLPAFAGGAVLGVLFFYGLWITIKDIDQMHNPAVRMLGSMLLRLSLVLAGLYGIGYYTGFAGVLAAAAGFMLARLLVVKHIAPTAAPHGSSNTSSRAPSRRNREADT